MLIIVLNKDGICAPEVYPRWKKWESAFLCIFSVISVVKNSAMEID
jgi:hypothetical protein